MGLEEFMGNDGKKPNWVATDSFCSTDDHISLSVLAIPTRARRWLKENCTTSTIWLYSEKYLSGDEAMYLYF